MKKIRIAIVGFGNIGQFAKDALLSSPDMELAGVVVHNLNKHYPGTEGLILTDSIESLNADAALLSVPSREVMSEAKKCLSLGINTVDSFDIHPEIYKLRESLDEPAKANKAVSIISAGWDPGTDSILRTMLEAMAPKGITHTNFGPGMSMGHTVVAKSKNGVADALSLTIPMGSGVHRRIVYVQEDCTTAFDDIVKEIKSDPYFSRDELVVIPVENVDSLRDRGHGVHMQRVGRSGITDNQRFDFSMSINNPALTAQIMVSCARAALKQKPGAYTMIELPLIDLLPGERSDIIKRLV